MSDAVSSTAAPGDAMVFDPHSLAVQVGRLGRESSPTVLTASQALYTPFHEREPYRDVRIERDIAYGSDERHRMDLFRPVASKGAAPVLLFVHGGGFVSGDKKRPGTPYQDNVALWAVKHGLIGVNMTYRLAPRHPWPAGAQDVSAALKWLMENAARHGIDPGRIYVMGTSAGAAHAATYVADPTFHVGSNAGIAGAILISGAYNLATAAPSKTRKAYYGDDRSTYERRSSMRGLVESSLPLMFVLAEFDPPDLERQALELVNAYYERHGKWPRFVRLMGHNHFTTTLHFNTPDDYFGRQIVSFTRMGSE